MTAFKSLQRRHGANGTGCLPGTSAWRRHAACAVRRIWGDGPVSDRRLAALYGVQEPILKGSSRKACHRICALAKMAKAGPPCEPTGRRGRRFELARLLADRLLFDEDERLHPATRTYTYRQKMQRAFAGEFLCPIGSLTDYLVGDYSDDAKEDAADRFRVSPLAVTTLLVSNGLIDRPRDT